MPQRRSRGEQQEETRHRLLLAARNVFVRVGYHAATVEAIAAEAGFTRGAVYANFPAGKPDLFLAVMQRVEAERHERLRTALNELDDATFARSYPQLVRPDPPDQGLAGATSEFLLSATDDARVREQLTAMVRALLQRTATLFSERLSHEESMGDFTPSELALAAVALSNGLAVIARVDPSLIPSGFEVRVIERLVAPAPAADGTADR